MLYDIFIIHFQSIKEEMNIHMLLNYIFLNNLLNNLY